MSRHSHTPPLTEIEFLISEDDRRNADPIHDHLPEKQGQGKINRVLELLDELQVEGLRSRAYEEGGSH